MNPSWRDAKLAFWKAKGKNVLLIGREGIGKTTMIREAMTTNGLILGESAAYYSSHDRDFIGDPTKAEVLLFDDLNDPQAAAAAQEVLNLRVWRGKPVTAYVWGSYNVKDEVEKGDNNDSIPLALRVFEIRVEVPYKPFEPYFTAKYGPRITQSALEWWGNLADEDQIQVSPRLLDAALKMYVERGDMRDVLPITANISRLATALNTGPISEKLGDLMKSKNEAETKLFLANENNYMGAVKFIQKSEAMMAYFLPLLPSRQLFLLMNDDDKPYCNYIINNSDKVPVFNMVCKEILTANTGRLAKKVRRGIQLLHPDGVAPAVKK